MNLTPDQIRTAQDAATRVKLETTFALGREFTWDCNSKVARAADAYVMTESGYTGGPAVALSGRGLRIALAAGWIEQIGDNFRRPA